MKEKDIAVRRFTARIRKDLMAKVERAAKKKRWSLNTFIEESLINAVAEIPTK